MKDMSFDEVGAVAGCEHCSRFHKIRNFVFEVCQEFFKDQLVGIFIHAVVF